MRVRSFRNTVLFFLFCGCKDTAKPRESKGETSLGGGGLGGRRRLSLCPTKRLFTSADDGE